MAYRIEPAKPVGEEIARLARGLLSAGAGTVTSTDETWEQRVHHARTTCKKVRALLRLLRAGHRRFFRRENRRLRKAADRLGVFRDAEALLAAARTLTPSDHTTRGRLNALQRRLTAHHRTILADREVIREQLAVFRRELRASLAVMRAWRPRERGFGATALEIETSYRKARRLGRRLDRRATGADYHEWRKAVKVFGYHCWLLRGAWPEMAAPFSAEVDRLGELLGEEHDLTVLGDFVTEPEGEKRKRPASAKCTLKLIDRQRQHLRRDARAAGARLFAEKPRAYLARLRRWWDVAAASIGGGTSAPSS